MLYLTPRAKAALDIAIQQAQQMGDQFVGTEHLLLGIFLEGEGPGSAILKDLGMTEEGLRRALNQVRSTGVDYEGNATGEGMLQKYTRDLTEMARDGKLDPVIGRDDEIKRVIQVLSRRTKNNPALIGEPGVGKTAIAEGLAQKIVTATCPRCCAASACWRSTWAPWSPAPNTAASSRSASRAPSTRCSAPKTSCCSSTSCTTWSAPARPRAPSTPAT